MNWLTTGVSFEEPENNAPAERLAELFEIYRARVYRFLVSQRINQTSAQELTQETFVRMFVALGTRDQVRAGVALRRCVKLGGGSLAPGKPSDVG